MTKNLKDKLMIEKLNNNRALLKSISNTQENGIATIIEMAEAIELIHKTLDSNIENINAFPRDLQEIKDHMQDCHDKLLYSVTKINDTIKKLT